MPRRRDRLRPAREVLARLRWDPRVDPSGYQVGWEDRERGLRFTPLLVFLAEGRVPTHRVREIRGPGGVVWDREARLDRVGDHLDDPETPPPPVTPDGRPALSWSGGEWRPAQEVEPLTARPDLLTWNLLAPRDEPASSWSRRLAGVLEHLAALRPDLVVLTEVTPPVLDALLEDPWIRREFLTSTPPGSQEVRPYGQLVLARGGLAQVQVVERTRDKRWVVTQLERGPGQPAVTLVALHATSDRARDAPARRQEEFRDLLRVLPGGPALVVGDLNADDPELEPLAAAGFQDAWSLAGGPGPGWTFDPERNALARAQSRSGRPRRLDRVLLRGVAVGHAQRRAAGAHPGEPRWLSDHAALAVRLDLRAAPTPDRATALAWTAPPEVAARLDRLRDGRDPARERWPPHSNLAFPFLAPDELEEAAVRLQRALDRTPPVRLTLDGVGEFPGRQAVLWARPASHPPEAQAAQRAACLATLPGWPPDARPWRPHWTLARCPRSRSTEVREQLAAALEPASFEADRLALFQRCGGRYQVAWTVEPGAGRWRARRLDLPRPAPAPPDRALVEALRTLRAWPDHDQRAAARAAVARAAAVAEATWLALGGPPPGLELVGSTALLGPRPGVDLDLVATAPHPSGALEHLADALAAGPARGARVATGRGPPRVEAELEGWVVDLQLAQPDGPGCPRRDRDRLADAASDLACGPAAFALALRALRTWSRHAALEGAAYGFFGGLAWAVAALDLARRSPEGASASAVLRGVLEGLAGWDGRRPLSVLDSPRAPPLSGAGHRQVVLVPSDLRRNAAHGATEATAAALCTQAQRALERLAAAGPRPDARVWAAVLAPPTPVEAPSWLCLQTAGDPFAQAAARGWLRGQALGLAHALEAETHTWARPVGNPRVPGPGVGACLRVALGRPLAEVGPALEDAAADLTQRARTQGHELTARALAGAGENPSGCG